ncbi:hypothetical protein SpCBS45565_g00966 [Spizellomyces sp. 'palustris']|nr:hypothetical protein SpCBS45565_g00966 [Spizellomyces sp. 'palustris']
MLSHTNPPSARRRSTVRPPILRVPPTETTPPPPPQPILPASQAARDASLELVTEQLGWAPVSYVDDIINSMNDLAYKGISSFETWLEEYGLDEEESEKGLAATETLFENNIDKQFDKFELFVLQSIFVVPTNLPIKLPHYEEVEFGVSAADEANADMELEEVRRRIVAARYLEQRLKVELESTETRRLALERMKRDVDHLAALKDDKVPLSETYTTLLATLRNTRTLSETLRKRSQNLSIQTLIAPSPDDAENVQSVIAAAMDRRRRKQEELARTPSRRRRSAGGGQVRSAREGAEYAIEYRERIGVGSATDVQAWRELLEEEQHP